MTPEELLDAAARVQQAATGQAPRATRHLPPPKAFRGNEAGRRAWLAHAEKELRAKLQRLEAIEEGPIL
jgi:hypothetical protein